MVASGDGQEREKEKERDLVRKSEGECGTLCRSRARKAGAGEVKGGGRQRQTGLRCVRTRKRKVSRSCSTDGEFFGT